jgi:SAM-dependent methyltransferase
MANGPALHPLVQRFADEGLLRCPRCGQPEVAGTGEAFVCAACGARFPTYNRVVDLHGLVAGSRAADGELESVVALARPVAQALDLPESAAMIATVAEVLGRTASLTSQRDEFDAEIRDIADRFGIDSGRPLDAASVGSPAAPQTVNASVDRHYIPAQLPPGVRVTGNVRFRNIGPESFSSASVPPVHIGIRWFDADQRTVTVPEHRTRFPLALTPGRAITVPVEIDTPPDEGVYTLVVCPVIEERRWVPESGLAVLVSVQPAVALPEVLDLQPDAQQPTYADDHVISLRILAERAVDLLAAPGRRILEIGGGAAPQFAWLGSHDVVNVDIDLPLLELGSLWYEHHAKGEVSERLAFLCADATDLPFESETFDIVAMFATLHHFPEPEVLLRECRRLVRPDGIVAILCEPIGATLESTDILRDLAKGINEQIFTIEEYLAIFAAAGLEPTAGQQLGGSLRVFLRRAEPSGASFTRVASVPPGLMESPRPAAEALDARAPLWLRVKRRLRDRT